MKHPSWHPVTRFLSLLTLSFLAACGGGGGSASAPGGTPTATITAGTVTGFGSVIVNGVRYSETGATVDSDDDDSFDRSQLQLGMVVEIEGEVNSDGVTGKARTIRARSEIAGTVSAIDATTQTLTIMDQLVTVNAKTVFPGGTVQPSSFTDLQLNDRLEIHGLRADATHITATHIARKAIGLSEKIRGVVSQLNAAAQTFTLNGKLTVNFASTSLPADIKNGSYVKVVANTAPVGNIVQASRVILSGRESNESRTAGKRREIKGIVSTFTSISDFQINGIKIDASAASGASAVALGAVLEIKGSYNAAGILIATKIESEDDVSDRDAYELKGPIDSFVSLSSFKVKGVTVDASKITPIPANLGNGVYIEVKGAMSGQTLLASHLEIKNAEKSDD